MKRGYFITLYGINNIGKSTQAKLLMSSLAKHGYKAVYLKYPIYDLEPTGPMLDKILRHEGDQKLTELELQKLFAQNRRDYEKQLRKLLDEGNIVVAEDYIGTGIAWGTAKGVSLEAMEILNDGLLEEDLSILCLGTRNLNAKEENHIHENDDELVKKVETQLLMLAKRYSWKTFVMKKRIQETADALWELVANFLLAEEKNA